MASFLADRSWIHRRGRLNDWLRGSNGTRASFERASTIRSMSTQSWIGRRYTHIFFRSVTDFVW